MANPGENISEFEKNILELKEPIFFIKVGDKINYMEIKLFINGDCVAKNYGEKDKIPNTFLVNWYYEFIRRFTFPPKIVLSPEGSLSSFFASYISNNGKK